ncbi:type III effector protein [Streptomyces sp. ISL-36]|nr:type III effector protein [Streptomyces sp. ISL-36]MBT2439564.1 type III effector protein [Streptomyces sp. ISL-36]
MAALRTIDEAVRGARAGSDGEGGGGGRESDGALPEQALAALLLLRHVRDQLAGWESGLIETARAAGASWADLAEPLGVASRQAAERRYLRLRPGAAGTTGEQRVQATRDRRAAHRTVAAWARHNAADLRRLAGQITALPDLPVEAGIPIDDLNRALAEDDAAHLVRPLTATTAHLRGRHPELAARIEDLTRQTERLSRKSTEQRRSSP